MLYTQENNHYSNDHRQNHPCRCPNHGNDCDLLVYRRQPLDDLPHIHQNIPPHTLYQHGSRELYGVQDSFPESPAWGCFAKAKLGRCTLHRVLVERIRNACN